LSPRYNACPVYIIIIFLLPERTNPLFFSFLDSSSQRNNRNEGTKKKSIINKQTLVAIYLFLFHFKKKKKLAVDEGKMSSQN